MKAFNFNFASRREGRLARGELLRVGDGNGQERKYEEQDPASEEEKGASAVGRSKGNILEPPFPLSLTLLSQLPALFSLPEKESMQELKTSTLLIVMALSHAILSTLGEWEKLTNVTQTRERP